MQKVLFLNHKQQACGVYQYGRRVADILKKSTVYEFVYCEVDSQQEYVKATGENNPVAIIYNHHPSTMPWANRELMHSASDSVHLCLYHEGSLADHGFNAYLIVDSTYIDTPGMYAVPRPLFENMPKKGKWSGIPLITSFGFGFGNKGFLRAIEAVNNEFDEALIRLHIPRAFYGDADGWVSDPLIEACKNFPRKEGIALDITTSFLSDQELLDVLWSGDLNIFLYDEMPGRGLSSVIDYALSVKVPICISKTFMFRHISNVLPSICIEDRSLRQIMGSGEVMQPYRDMWSHKALVSKYEFIVSKHLK